MRAGALGRSSGNSPVRSAGGPPTTSRSPSYLPSDRQTCYLGLVSVALAASLVAVGFWVGGVIASNQPVSTPVDYTVAADQAVRAATSQYGGSWIVVTADGINVKSTTALQLNFTNTPSCPFTPAPGAPAGNFTLPVLLGSAGAGFSPMWTLILRSTSREVVVIVVNGMATVLGSYTGALCVDSPGGAVPSDVLTSEAASAAANDAGGTAFLAQNPGANALLTLTAGPNRTLPPEFQFHSQWLILYSTCPLNSNIAQNGSAFEADVNSTNGAFINQTTVSGLCFPNEPLPSSPSLSSAIPIGTALGFGAPAEAKTGITWYYNLTIEATTSGVTTGDTHFEIQTPTGSVVSVVGFVTLLNPVAQTIAVFDLSSGSWTTGSTIPYAASQELSVAVTSPSAGLSGDSLVVFGNGIFGGSISVPLP